MRVPSLLVAFAIGLAVPAVVSAHVSVTAATPAAGSTAKAPKTVILAFDKPVDQASAAASIVMTAMPGMANHGEMVIRNFTMGWSPDRQTMTLSLKKPLSAGTYEVRWQATAADGHLITGVVSFDVA
jgi:methionine-rich copper-binding protein CopC